MTLHRLFFFVLLAMVATTGSAFARQASEVCTLIAQRNSANVPRCMEAISRGFVSDLAADVCYETAGSDTAKAVACLESSVNQQFDPSAANVCMIVARRNTANVPSCMSACANKSYPNGMADPCRIVSESDTARAVQCLNNSGVPFQPWPNPACPTTQDSRITLDRSLALLYNGRYNEAAGLLSDLRRRLDACRF